MNKKVGFLGLGKMATAIISGILDSDYAKQTEVQGYDINPEAGKKIQEKYSFKILESAKEVVKNSDIIFLCTKPFVIRDVLKEIASCVNSEKTIVSIAAGISIEIIEEYLGSNTNIIRIMPNTPALVKTGMSVLCANKKTSQETVNYVKDLLKAIGKVIELDEKLLDAVTALSGSGPAFYYYLINEFALAGEKIGLPYKEALLMSAQTAMGAARMMLETGDTPETLIKNVTTPGGTTEVGNNILNQSNIPAIFDEVIAKTAQKSKELGKK